MQSYLLYNYEGASYNECILCGDKPAESLVAAGHCSSSMQLFPLRSTLVNDVTRLFFYVTFTTGDPFSFV